MTQAPDLRELCPTGLKNLDVILRGGILRGNSIVIEGRPGTGKTALALDLLHRGITERNEAGLFISFEIPRIKILRDAVGFGWKSEELERNGQLHILMLDPANFLADVRNPASSLWQRIESQQIRRIVLDGLRSLRIRRASGASPSFREELTGLVSVFAERNIDLILTTETSSTPEIGEPADGDEQYLCDMIISLRQQPRRRSVQRSLEVTKSRGQSVIAGRHGFRISNGKGVVIFPRVYARSEETVLDEQPTSNERSSVGIPALDEMLGGGVLRGSTTLAVGISGTGKTVLGLQFLLEGAKQGKKGLFVTLDEHREQIIRNAENMELGLKAAIDDGSVSILYDAPFELEIDEHFYRIRDFIEREGIERVVIDSLAAYETAQPEEFHEFTFALTAYFKQRLIDTLFAFEGPELFGVSSISEQLKTSAIVDNIILMNYVEISTILRRAISVPKTRGGRNSRRTREYLLQKGGIAILDDRTVEDVPEVPQLPLSSYYGVLARAPTRRSPVIDEHLASGTDLPPSKVPKPGDVFKKPKKNGKSARRVSLRAK